MRPDRAREAFAMCPYCGSSISIVVDPTVERQDYIEDCEVCCRPIEFILIARDGEVSSIEANRID
jgi:hypothetical protein